MPSQDKLVTPAIRGIETVADIFSYSAPTHGDIKASGLRDTIRVVEEKEVTKVIDRRKFSESCLVYDADA